MPSFDCPRCGAALRRGRKFCSSCGLALVACPACGGVNGREARFCGDCGGALPSAEAIAAPAGEEAGDAGAAERRQLTVMFCDLVGSTALSDRLDPEDLQLVIAAFHSCAAGLVARFDGAVAQYLGDGLLVYFGYPHAHEDDAERSVRAALAIIAAVHELRPVEGVALQTRIGIATGLVVIGELIGDGTERRHAVVGKTPNLAARLQSIAETDSVVIGPATRQLIHALFDCVDLGSHSLKGIAEPVTAWRVVGERPSRNRFAALHEGTLTPFIGRDPELAVIRRRWAEAKAGRGQVVLLSGEPGMGKSRMVQALRDGLRAEPSYRLSYHGSPYHQNTAFHGIIELLERGAGLLPRDSPGQRLAKLERLLERSGCNRPDVAAPIASLLAIPTDDRHPPLTLEPPQRRERVGAAILDHLAGLAARRPILVNFEDAGLLDPSTLALLGRLIERAQTLPILVMITFRPSFDPPWAGYPHVLPIRLERLDRRRSLALIAEIAGPRPLPAAIVEQVATQTDGVPLFIEEITRTLLERDTHDVEAVELEVPSSLQDTLMARLDRLARAKPVAQLGAALGRAFSHELLAAVASLDERELGRALDKLIAAGLSTPWCVTPPTPACCTATASACMPASPRRSRRGFPTPRRPSPSCWPITAPRPGWSTRRSRTGRRRLPRPMRGWPMPRRSPISAGRWRCSPAARTTAITIAASSISSSRSAPRSWWPRARRRRRPAASTPAPASSPGDSTTHHRSSPRSTASGSSISAAPSCRNRARSPTKWCG